MVSLRFDWIQNWNWWLLCCSNLCQRRTTNLVFVVGLNPHSTTADSLLAIAFSLNETICTLAQTRIMGTKHKRLVVVVFSFAFSFQGISIVVWFFGAQVGEPCEARRSVAFILRILHKTQKVRSKRTQNSNYNYRLYYYCNGVWANHDFQLAPEQMCRRVACDRAPVWRSNGSMWIRRQIRWQTPN